MQRFQIVIVFLLVLNLVATLWFGINQGRVSPKERASLNALPSVFTDAEKARLYNRFQLLFNAGDFEGLYDLFSPIAKAQFSEEQAIKEFTRLKQYYDAVNSGAFQYSEFAGNKGSNNYYNLYFSVKFSDESGLGRSGLLKITVATDNYSYEVYGIRLN